MIFMVCLGRIRNSHEISSISLTQHVEVLAGNVIFKLYKMQTKSENHETCRGVVLSHVEAVVKNCKGFEQVVTSDAKNPDIST